MKKLLTVFIVLIALQSVNLFAQESSTDSEISFNQNQNLGKMIVHYEGFSKGNSYCFADKSNSKVLAGNELFDILQTVPQNEQLIKKAKTWKVLGVTLLSLAGVTLATSLTYNIIEMTGTNLVANDIVVPICNYASIFSVLFGLESLTFGNIRIQQAVDNYNISLK